MPRRMSRLGQKIMASVALVLLCVILFSLYLNASLIGRYYLYLEKRDLNRIVDALAGQADAALSPPPSPGKESGLEAQTGPDIAALEESGDVTIVQVAFTQDNEQLNYRLREAFAERGLGFRKFWLWDQDQNALPLGERRMRLYRQEGLHYSLLVEYLHLPTGFLAAVKVIPETERTISLINHVTFVIFAGAVVVILLLLFFFVRRITGPLREIGLTARSIASLDFRTVEVRTNDELETLADCVSDMSRRLEQAHRQLEEKNRQMKDLLANVSHDLKTPLSLVKAYASGMRDGLDDGTFPGTILDQTERMERLVGRLLELAKMQSAPGRKPEPVDLRLCLSERLRESRIRAEERGLRFELEVDGGGLSPAFLTDADPDDVTAIFSNLISNAVQYAAPGAVKLSLTHCAEGVLFQIRNQIGAFGGAIDTDRLWEPFYVAEASRSSSLSGTGLGLSIVRAAAEKYGWPHRCSLSGDQIEFSILFVKPL